MVIALSTLSKVCFALVIGYLLFSLQSAIWVARRHECKYFHLEYRPRRARGANENARLRQLIRMRFCATLALPVGIVAFVTHSILS